MRLEFLQQNQQNICVTRETAELITVGRNELLAAVLTKVLLPL